MCIVRVVSAANFLMIGFSYRLEEREKNYWSSRARSQGLSQGLFSPKKLVQKLFMYR